MDNWPEITAQISTVTQSRFNAQEITAIGGGCINQAYCIADEKQRYFVKLNTADSLPMFEAEAAGLMEIVQSDTLRVPRPVCCGQNNRTAWSVLEHIQLGNNTRANAAELGAGLAAMHRTHAAHFGWVRDNTIGNTPQINTQSSDWSFFWRTHRLAYQLDLAKANGYTGKLQNLGEQLLTELDLFFSGVAPHASLLHGDLWNGNYSFDDAGHPVLFDPAIYYGDREADIAMTELFGGFPSNFYSAYRHEYPLDSGYNVRKVVYNLYHVLNHLNHLNLFGGSYRNQAEQMMNRLLTEIR
jgi:protein-ribulosamine 3-kinase